MNKTLYKFLEIGFYNFLFSFVGMIISFIIVFYSLGQLTPKSVSVSGYTRRDGTYVSGYSRRPSGGATHDAPYESMGLIFGLTTLFCGIYFFSLVSDYRNFDIESHFKYKYKFKNEYPKINYRFHSIPTISVVPKKIGGVILVTI